MKRFISILMVAVFALSSTNGFAVTQGPTNFTGSCSVNGNVSTTGTGGNTYLNKTGGNVVMGSSTDNGSGALAQVNGFMSLAPVSLPGTATAGNLVNTGKGLAFTPTTNSDVGVVPSAQFASLTSSYTLTSQTAAQKLFNVGTSNNGTFALSANTTYYFDCVFSLTTLSATSGTFGFALGGLPSGATYSFQAMASKTTGNTQGAVTSVYSTTASTALTANGTGTAGTAHIWGVIRVAATGGTVQPQVSLSQASAAVVGANSYFFIWPAGTDTTTTVGNVS